MKKLNFPYTALVAGFLFGLSVDAHAVQVKEISFVNDGSCFSKIKLYFENEKMSDFQNLSPDADHKIFKVITGAQEVCDDDGGFTTLLIYRAIQSFASKHPENALKTTDMSEWVGVHYSLFASIEFFAKKLNAYAAGGGRDYGELAAELLKEKAELEKLEYSSIKFSQFEQLGIILEKYFSGGDYSRALLLYTAFPKYPSAEPLGKYGLTDSVFSMPPRRRFGAPEAQYQGNFDSLFSQFEAECRNYLGVFPANTVIGNKASISATYRRASDGQLRAKTFDTEIPQSEDGNLAVSEPQMYKTYVLMGIANAMRDALSVKVTNKAEAIRSLRQRVFELNNFVKEHSVITQAWRGQKSWTQVVNLAAKLADNLESFSPPSYSHYESSRGGTRGGGISIQGAIGPSKSIGSRSLGMSSESFNVSSGGAQSAGKAWDMIEQGEIPTLKDFNVGGFLKEFDLSISDVECPEGEICFGSGVAVDPQQGKLWVQMNMGINPSDQQRKRKPLNVSVLIDISGSMSSRNSDSTTRMQWARTSLSLLFGEIFQPGDVVSVYKFDDKIESFMEPTLLNSEKQTSILNTKFSDFQPRGTTNLGLALRTGFDGVRMKQIELGADQTNYEHFVILISDAQANTGETTDHALKGLVQTAAADQIGLIAIGIGSANRYDTGFNQELVDVISQSRGGSYDFVSSTQDMDRVLDRLPYLLNPIAYELKATLKVEGARLFRMFGTASDENSVPKSAQLISIPTMVLTPSEEGGGATIVEFDIPKKRKLISTENACVGPFCSSSLK